MEASLLLSLSLSFLSHERKRALLAFLSISLGLFLFFLATFLTSALPFFVEKSFSKLGRDVVLVLPLSDVSLSTAPMAQFRARTASFSEREVKEMALLTGSLSTSPALSGYATLHWNGKDQTVSIQGVDNIGETFPLLSLSQGRWYRSGEVVVGHSLWQDLGEPRLGKALWIGGRPFTLVGVLEKVGSSLYPADDRIFLSTQDAKALLQRENYDGVALRVPSPENARRVLEAYLERKGKEASVVTYESLLRDAQALSAQAQLFSLLASSVSFLIGLLTLANILYMNVKDHTRIIGTLKAIGARPGFSMTLFLLQGMLLFFASLITALLTAALLSYAILSHLEAPLQGWPTATLASLIATLFALLSSYFPAREAEALEAAEALRYE